MLDHPKGMTVTIKTTWEQGLPAEVDFWSRWASNNSEAFRIDFEHRVRPDSVLQPLITDYLERSAPSVSILDVGAGPLTFLGKTWGECKVEISACDALADEYDRITESSRL